MTTREYFEKKNGFLRLQNSLLMLPKEQALMLAYLIDTEGWDEAKRLTEDSEYFWANKDGFISSYLLGWSIKEIDNAIKKLEANGYITTKIINVDMRKRTYIKLNLNNIIGLDNLYELIQAKRRELNIDEQKELLANIRKVCSGTAKRDVLEQQIGMLIHM